ncbi:MAG: alkaline phosphatase family protein [Planctomycetaceae bacterium]
MGPDDPAIAADIRAVDAEAGRLIDAALARDAHVVVVSEYAITAVGPQNAGRGKTPSRDCNWSRSSGGWLYESKILRPSAG